MIYDVSYRDRKIILAINELVGKPYGIIERFRMKGVGSPRYKLGIASDEIQKRLPLDYSSVNISFELRPKGVIIHFKKFTEHFNWIIPYYKLTIYHSDNLSVYGEGNFMKIGKNTLRKTHRKFLNKLIELKAKYSENYLHL